MKKSLIASGIIFVLIIFVGMYFLMRVDNGDDLITQNNKLYNDLVTAKQKLTKEKQKLEILKNELRYSFPFAVSVQNQMQKATDIVKQTDFMFTDANGLNPELIIKNFLNSIRINNERKDINALLLEWQTKINILSVGGIDISASEQIKKEIETIKTYIEELTSLVGSLTEKNSGLSQLQIDTYASQLPPVGAIDEVLASLEEAIQNNKDNQAVVPTVIPSDVVNQEVVVGEAQNQVDVIQKQVDQIVEPVVEPVPIPVVPENNPITNPEPETPTNTNNSFNYDNFYLDRSTYKGIIVQPGPPSLIQGDNQY